MAQFLSRHQGFNMGARACRQGRKLIAALQHRDQTPAGFVFRNRGNLSGGPAKVSLIEL